MKKMTYLTCPDQRRFWAKQLRLRRVLRDTVNTAERVGDPTLVLVAKNMQKVGSTGPIAFFGDYGTGGGFWKFEKLVAEMGESNHPLHKELLILQNKIDRL